MKKLKNTVGFDLGTSKLRLYKNGKQIVDTPTKFDFNNKTYDKLMSVGKISDFNATELLLRIELKKCQKRFLGFLYLPFNAIVSVPSDLNEVALRAFRDSMEHAGAKDIYMLNDCFVAAKGLSIDIKSSTSMIVDCGAGKTSITTIQGFEIVKNDILDIAGDGLNETIRAFLSSKYQMKVDLETIENIKTEHLDLRKNLSIDRQIKIAGKTKLTHKNQEITVSNSEITECLNNDIEMLVNRIVRHFENLEDIDVRKIKANGIHLIGGGFKLKGLVQLVSEKLTISRESYNSNLNYMKIGMEKIQSHPEELREHMIS